MLKKIEVTYRSCDAAVMGYIDYGSVLYTYATF